METLESKEIKGLSLRSLFWMLTCTCSILFSIFTVYFNLKQQIERISIERVGEEKLNELKMHDLDTKIDLNKAEISDIKFRLTTLEMIKPEIK